MDAVALWLGLVDAAIDTVAKKSVGGTVDSAPIHAAAEKLCELCRNASSRRFMTTVSDRFGLSPLDELALWTLIAQQVNPQAASRLSALAGGDLDLGTLAIVAFGGVTARAVSALTGPRGLVGRGLIERTASAKTQTWAQRTIRIPDRILRIALGTDEEDVDPARELIFHDDSDVDLSVPLVVRPLEDLVIEHQTITQLHDAFDAESAAIVTSGISGSGRRSALLSVAVARGQRVLCMDARRVERDRERAFQQLRAFARECLLGNRTPLIANIDLLHNDADDRLDWFIREFESRMPGVVLATCGLRTPPMRWSRPTFVMGLGRPSTKQREQQWRRVMENIPFADPASLAKRFQFAPALVQRIGDALHARKHPNEIDQSIVTNTIRGVIDDRLGAYATRVATTQSWDDLVLPTDQLEALVELRSRIRGRSDVYEDWGFGSKLGRGLGVSALFSGPPGTGKTMVAGLLAADLGLELYQVDLGKVVSKYIGETEKNLAGLFDAAEASCALLLFDEADSMFGKRTDMKSSNDRYANLETNYLLQRLESFGGVCCLTTNHETNIDPAFMRRLSMHVRFEMPEVEERERLWQAMIPASAPVESGIDFGRLADRYVMSGGHIRNAVLRAAFLAFDEGGKISAGLLERAAHREYEAIGKIAEYRR